jgi:hypothetical protein
LSSILALAAACQTATARAATGGSGGGSAATAAADDHEDDTGIDGLLGCPMLLPDTEAVRNAHTRHTIQQAQLSVMFAAPTTAVTLLPNTGVHCYSAHVRTVAHACINVHYMWCHCQHGDCCMFAHEHTPLDCMLMCQRTGLGALIAHCCTADFYFSNAVAASCSCLLFCSTDCVLLQQVEGIATLQPYAQAVVFTAYYHSAQWCRALVRDPPTLSTDPV